MLHQCCVRLSSVAMCRLKRYVLWLNGRPRAQVNDCLQEVVCEESIGTKMNDLYVCLQVV